MSIQRTTRYGKFIERNRDCGNPRKWIAEWYGMDIPLAASLSAAGVNCTADADSLVYGEERITECDRQAEGKATSMIESIK